MSRNKWIWLILGLAGAISLALGPLVPSGDHTVECWWTPIFAIVAILGFVGCVAMIFVAKWLGRYWLQRKGDYYD